MHALCNIFTREKKKEKKDSYYMFQLSSFFMAKSCSAMWKYLILRNWTSMLYLHTSWIQINAFTGELSHFNWSVLSAFHYHVMENIKSISLMKLNFTVLQIVEALLLTAISQKVRTLCETTASASNEHPEVSF